MLDIVGESGLQSRAVLCSEADYVLSLTQFVIVCVVRDSLVYGSFQDDQLRLLDVIKTVNDKPCSSLHIPGMDLQDSFERAIEDREFVKLSIDRSIALPPFSSPLAFGR